MNTLLLVDVQNDFHDGGSLAIPGASADAERLAAWILQHTQQIHRVVATMDTHPVLHIAHAGFWVNSSGTGAHPTPFTIISHADLQKGVWKPRPGLHIPPDSLDSNVLEGSYALNTDQGILDYCLEYTRRLEQGAPGRSKFQLCVWPDHCRIGSAGHGIVPCVYEALTAWSQSTGRDVEYIRKGENMLTEMYSVMQAEVPVTKDTAYQTALQASFFACDDANAADSTLYVCGQASSHCVNYTLRDIVEHCTEDQRKKIVLLTDTTSAVPGFEAAGSDFLKDMKTAGVSLQTTTEVDLRKGE